MATGAAESAEAVGPWDGFVLAADAAVRNLNDVFGLDLWLVTHVREDEQVVVASAGPWDALAAPGVVFPWASSFCRRMVRDGVVVIEPDVHRSPAYADIAVGVLARVRAYVGVPLMTSDGQLFGALCAYAGEPQPLELAGAAPQVRLVGRLLSTVLAREQLAAERSQDAARAYALVERDGLTGLRNRRGWENALRVEEQRARRYGSAVSVLALDLGGARGDDGPEPVADDAVLAACARVLETTHRPGDVLARVGGAELGVLAIECDARCARALALRLRTELRSAGAVVALGYASRRLDESLEDTWRRAHQAVSRDRRMRVRGPVRNAG